MYKYVIAGVLSVSLISTAIVLIVHFTQPIDDSVDIGPFPPPKPTPRPKPNISRSVVANQAVIHLPLHDKKKVQNSKAGNMVFSDTVTIPSCPNENMGLSFSTSFTNQIMLESPKLSDYSKSWSMAVWIKPVIFSDYNEIIQIVDKDPKLSISLGIKNNKLVFTAPGIGEILGSEITLNVYTHVMVAMSLTKVTVYVNGKSQISKGFVETSKFANSVKLLIGSHMENDKVEFAKSFIGYIYDFNFYGTHTIENNAIIVMNADHPVSRHCSPIHYSFSSIHVQEFADNSLSNIDIGRSVKESQCPVTVRSYYFPGDAQSYVEYRKPMVFDSYVNVSLTFSFKPESLTHKQYLVDVVNSGGERFSVAIDATSVYVVIRDVETKINNVTSLSKFSYFAIVTTKTKSVVYLNSIKIHEIPMTRKLFSSPVTFVVGNQDYSKRISGSESFSGYIRDFKVFNSSLTAEQIPIAESEELTRNCSVNHLDSSARHVTAQICSSGISNLGILKNFIISKYNDKIPNSFDRKSLCGSPALSMFLSPKPGSAMWNNQAQVSGLFSLGTAINDLILYEVPSSVTPTQNEDIYFYVYSLNSQPLTLLLNKYAAVDSDRTSPSQSVSKSINLLTGWNEVKLTAFKLSLFSSLTLSASHTAVLSAFIPWNRQPAHTVPDFVKVNVAKITSATVNLNFTTVDSRLPSRLIKCFKLYMDAEVGNANIQVVVQSGKKFADITVTGTTEQKIAAFNFLMNPESSRVCLDYSEVTFSLDANTENLVQKYPADSYITDDLCISGEFPLGIVYRYIISKFTTDYSTFVKTCHNPNYLPGYHPGDRGQMGSQTFMYDIGDSKDDGMISIDRYHQSIDSMASIVFYVFSKIPTTSTLTLSGMETLDLITPRTSISSKAISISFDIGWQQFLLSNFVASSNFKLEFAANTDATMTAFIPYRRRPDSTCTQPTGLDSKLATVEYASVNVNFTYNSLGENKVGTCLLALLDDTYKISVTPDNNFNVRISVVGDEAKRINFYKLLTQSEKTKQCLYYGCVTFKLPSTAQSHLNQFHMNIHDNPSYIAGRIRQDIF